MDLIDIKKEKLVGFVDWFILVEEGKVMGLCILMNSSNDRGIDLIYKIFILGFILGYFCYLRSYWYRKNLIWKVEN